MRPRIAALLLLLAGPIAPARADDFGRLEGASLNAALRSESAEPRPALSAAELGNLPRVLDGVRSGLVLVKTGEGNPARLLVAAALRRPPAPADGAAMKKDAAPPEPTPILVLERFDTFEAGPATTRLAHGKDLLLFDGFQFDLDTGQVVPEGQGGDLRFVAKDGGRLEPVGGASLFTLKAPPAFAAAPGAPSPGKAIVPTDFAGRYRLTADGQWSGTLDLEVGPRGVVTGRFRSDQTGTSYRVTGGVAPDAANHLLFAIQFPRSRQEYDARLWTGGKGAMAGTVSLLESTFGFVAVREGGRLAPDDAESAPSLEGESPLELTVEAEGKVRQGDRVLEAAALATLLNDRRRDHPDGSVVVRVPASVPFKAVRDLLDTLDAAGFDAIRLERAR
jgi:hypothetical protein